LPAPGGRVDVARALSFTELARLAEALLSICATWRSTAETLGEPAIDFGEEPTAAFARDVLDAYLFDSLL